MSYNVLCFDDIAKDISGTNVGFGSKPKKLNEEGGEVWLLQFGDFG